MASATRRQKDVSAIAVSTAAGTEACAVCGRPFVRNRSNQKYCTARCRSTAAASRRRNARATEAAALRRKDSVRIVRPRTPPQGRQAAAIVGLHSRAREFPLLSAAGYAVSFAAAALVGAIVAWFGAP